MDDFLHNLRSGKLKQVDRTNRSYNDQQFKGGPRRNMDRRKGHYDNKESSERLHAIKEVLETLAESQKRMTEAYLARTRAEERKARAMEVLAKNLYRMLNPNAADADELFALEQPESPREQTRPAYESAQANHTAEAEQEAFSDESQALNDSAEEMDTYSAEADEVANEDEMQATGEGQAESSGRLTEVDRQTLFRTIDQMRGEGYGWEKIARHISSQGYPTVSGKGSWRGIMVKNLFERMATAS
ncbi:MAG: hypothetical protein C4519_26545 [Desulfobacteraceae bacterium]|nr:MAG: hypothetical protein C4519_26545 [Desulfobacteraceae bacterium]